MKKNKPAPPANDPALAHELLELALDLREFDEYAHPPDELKKKRGELRKRIRKCLQQQKDAPLVEALEYAQEEDRDAWRVLKANIEELAENVVFRRDDGADVEINAFVIPLFVRSRGGLRAEQDFQDEAAFDALRASLQQGGLESRDARVVLVSHAYHRDEIAQIGYGQLNAMVHEAHAAMTRRKTIAAQAIASSMRGWPDRRFDSGDLALELRFLLGFALKRLDDPFYAVPEDEAAADRYFAARAERFRRWAVDNLALVQRCLVTDGREIEIDFLYQDLFYSGTASADAEHAMLEMLTGLQQALDEQQRSVQEVHAIVGRAEDDDMPVLRVHLLARDGDALLAAADKPLLDPRNPQPELHDLCDALRALGVSALAVARRFDGDGRPQDLRPYRD